jgi:hypothetical protein
MKEEKRRHSRRTAAAEIRDYRGSKGVHCAEIINISLGGIRLELTAKEKPGTKVELSMRLEQHQSPLTVRGMVVWARQVAPFEAGICFLEMDFAEHPTVKQFLGACA